MASQGAAAHVINTVSMTAFGAEPDLAVYGSTKHACTAITEVLRTELADTPARVCGLYPGGVLTDITNSGRNRTAQYGGPAAGLNSVPDSALRDDAHMAEDLLNPIDVGRIVRLAVEQDTPWIFTHPHWVPRYAPRWDEIATPAHAALADRRAGNGPTLPAWV
jgi:NAD(P)-dependent dehydrogenase (short-subunit alcohol dehydrogenase family)